MFIKLITKDKKNIAVNTSQITTIYGNELNMSDGSTVCLDGEYEKMINECIFGSDNQASPAASEHTSSLLNELNKLLGGKNDAKPTTDRKARLKARLKDFTEEELKIAAKNLGSDEFMQGANDNNKRYGTIDYLIRTSANINKWLEDQPQKKKGMF